MKNKLFISFLLMISSLTLQASHEVDEKDHDVFKKALKKRAEKLQKAGKNSVNTNSHLKKPPKTDLQKGHVVTFKDLPSKKKENIDDIEVVIKQNGKEVPLHPVTDQIKKENEQMKKEIQDLQEQEENQKLKNNGSVNHPDNGPEPPPSDDIKKPSLPDLPSKVNSGHHDKPHDRPRDTNPALFLGAILVTISSLHYLRTNEKNSKSKVAH